MAGEAQIVFGFFRFERSSGRLWRGDHEVHLRARTKAVLGYLLEHPGRIISRQEFAQHVWPYTHVSQSVLRVCIWELRQALGEQGGAPRFIETVGRQGYRFGVEPQLQEVAVSQVAPFVAREAELSQLQQALHDAQHGRPQLTFITGDAGIGKTTLVQQFLLHLPASVPVRIGHGQCIEHFGPGEAYLPLLEALGRLGREPRGERLLAELRRVAPTWLVHLPMLLGAGDLEALQLQVHRSSGFLSGANDAMTRYIWINTPLTYRWSASRRMLGTQAS